MPKLIALVTVVTTVDGKRQEFAPGSELPELPEHDIIELKRMGAIEDLAETAAAEKRDAKAEAVAGADFQKERKAVQAAKSSTTAPVAEKSDKTDEK